VGRLVAKLLTFVCYPLPQLWTFSLRNCRGALLLPAAGRPSDRDQVLSALWAGVLAVYPASFPPTPSLYFLLFSVLRSPHLVLLSSPSRSLSCNGGHPTTLARVLSLSVRAGRTRAFVFQVPQIRLDLPDASHLTPSNCVTDPYSLCSIFSSLLRTTCIFRPLTAFMSARRSCPG